MPNPAGVSADRAEVTAESSAGDRDGQHTCVGKGDLGALADGSHGSQTQAAASDEQAVLAAS